MLNENTYIKIEEYLKGTMSESNRMGFEKDIEANAELKELVVKHKFMNSLLLENKLLSIKTLSQEIHQEALIQKKRKTKNIAYISTAILVGIVGFTLYYYNVNTAHQNNTSTTEQKTSVTVEEMHNKDLNTSIITDNNNTTPSSEQEKKEGIYTPEKITSGSDLIPDNSEATIASTNPSVTLPREREEHKNTAEATNTKAGVTASYCDNTLLSVDTEVASPCAGDSNGAIYIQSTQGGKAPYRYSLYNDSQEELPSFTHLSKGSFTLVVEDANRCITKTHIRISEKSCAIHHLINISDNTYLTIPESHHDRVFTVRDKAHNIYYTKNIPAHSEYTWEGKSDDGILKEGVYIYTIEYKNNSITGTITITE